MYVVWEVLLFAHRKVTVLCGAVSQLIVFERNETILNMVQTGVKYMLIHVHYQYRTLLQIKKTVFNHIHCGRENT